MLWMLQRFNDLPLKFRLQVYEWNFAHALHEMDVESVPLPASCRTRACLQWGLYIKTLLTEAAYTDERKSSEIWNRLSFLKLSNQSYWRTSKLNFVSSCFGKLNSPSWYAGIMSDILMFSMISRQTFRTMIWLLCALISILWEMHESWSATFCLFG